MIQSDNGGRVSVLYGHPQPVRNSKVGSSTDPPTRGSSGARQAKRSMSVFWSNFSLEIRKSSLKSPILWGFSLRVSDLSVRRNQGLSMAEGPRFGGPVASGATNRSLLDPQIHDGGGPECRPAPEERAR